MSTRSLSCRLRRLAATVPEDVAIAVGGGARLTYGDWDRRSAAQAWGLVHSGLPCGVPVVLVADAASWTEYAVAYMAVQRAAAIAVPLPASLSDIEVARVVRTVGARMLLSPNRVGPSVDTPTGTVAPVDPRELETSDTEAHDPRPPLPPSSPCEILCVSRPLALPELHRRTAAEVLAGDGWPPGAPTLLARGGALLHPNPVGSVAGQAALVAALGETPMRSLILPAFDADGTAELIATGAVSAMVLHPALATALLDSGATDRHDVTALRVLILTSGPVPARLADRLQTVFPRAALVTAEPLPTMPGADTAVAAEGSALVSTAQEGMIWHEVFAPGCQNIQGLARRHRGPLDVHALDRALDGIVRRHAPLRTTFELRDDCLLQTIHAPGRFVLATRDLTALSDPDREAEVERLIMDAGRRPFDLVTGPLFEVTLLRLGPEDHVLVIRTHHLVFDDWSVAVFRRELAALYAGHLEGRAPTVPVLPVSFADASARQRAALAGPAGDHQRAFWRRELAGAPLTTQLPVADPALPPGAPQPPGGPIAMALSPDLSAAVRDLARRERTTVFMTMLAAFGALTHLVTGQDDLLLSIIAANRNRADLQSLIGCFSKKVPLRLRLDGDPTFLEVIARTRRAALGALSAQDLPFEALMQKVLGPAAARHGLVPHPAVLFQAVMQGPPLALPGLTSTGLETSRRTAVAHFMAAREGAGPATPPVPWGAGLYHGTFVNLALDDSAQLTFLARGAFHGPLVRRLLENLRHLVEAVVAAPESRVSSIDLEGWAGKSGLTGRHVDLRGFHVDLGRIEEALRACPGVREVDVELANEDDGDPVLVAGIVEEAAPPTADDLRAHLWSRLPGYAWPAIVRVVPGSLASSGAPAPRGWTPVSPGAGQPPPQAGDLGALRALHPRSEYWQSLPFLEALRCARDAGAPVPNRLVARNRTIEALATAIAAARLRSDPGSPPTQS